jgi:omega-6 fatty acid desaturase (delta-12 desaturase)
VVARYERPTVGRSVWQVANTLVPYAALWYAMARSLSVSYWLTLLLAIPAAGFFVRLFVIFHDCGHNSFFASRRANRVVGTILGMVTFTPYDHWRHLHALHHATSSDLDRRGAGDVWTLTVEEYRAAPWWTRCSYRLLRNPVVLFGVAPLVLFGLIHRFPPLKAGRRARASVLWTDLGLLGTAALIAPLIGIRGYLLIQVAVLTLAASAGMWLFYVQHQFEGAYWARRHEWDYVAAALHGSSFYRLPRVLQWFTANIGFHHIHHLSPGIPNYRLEACANADPRFRAVRHLTLLASLKALTYRLWDERRQAWVGYAAVRSRGVEQPRG